MENVLQHTEEGKLEVPALHAAPEKPMLDEKTYYILKNVSHVPQHCSFLAYVPEGGCAVGC